jgi:hypothetical protein
MTLNVSLDGGSSWSVCTPALIDFEQYPALRLRFIDAANEEELPSWIAPLGLSPQHSPDDSIEDEESTVCSLGKMEY